MDWGTVIAAFVGAAIPSSGTLLTLRAERRRRLQDRRWLDSDVVADVQQFLSDIEPGYRIAHIDREAGAEARRWEDLEARRAKVQRELVKLTTGHDDPTVRELAESMAVLLVAVTTHSKFAVSDEIQGRDNPEWLATARKEYEKAHECAVTLGWAVQEVGTQGRFERLRATIRIDFARLLHRKTAPPLDR